MDFDFSDDQNQLRDAVARYVSKAYPFERRQANEKSGGFDAGAYAELAELGLTGLCVASDFDGMDLGPIEAMIVMEELGKGMVLEPLNQAIICAPVLQNFASDALKKQWLPAIASGQAIVSLAYQERQSRHSLTPQLTVAHGVDPVRVSGKKINVAAAPHAKAFLVSALHNGQTVLLCVDAAHAQHYAYSLQDGTSAGDVHFDDSPATVVTTDGASAMQLAHDLGATLLCAEAVGVMERALAVTVDYMNTRKQFGATLASFQALRHRVADMKMQLELARSMSFYAALRVGAPPHERTQAVARASAQLGQSMRFVGQQAVQLHGGIGVTDEYIVSHHFRVLSAMELKFGDTMHHLGEVANRMTDTAGVFA